MILRLRLAALLLFPLSVTGASGCQKNHTTNLVANADAMQILEDSKLMRQELLRHIPIGTPIDQAQKSMTKNVFDCSIHENPDPHLYCVTQRTETLAVSCKWQIMIDYEDSAVTDIVVSTGFVGL